MSPAALAVLLLIAILAGLLVDRIFFRGPSTAGTGSGVTATQVRSLAPFSRVDLEGDNNVVIRVGARQSVVVHADRNLLGRITTRVRSGRLVIGTTPGNLSTKSPMFVEVSLPSLHGLTLHGNGNITADGIDSRRLAVALPGNGNIVATGTATVIDVSLGGHGTVRLHELGARDAHAVLGGTGTIMLTATNSLAATISGSGTILYGGAPPHLTQRVIGSGTIIAG